MLVMRIVLATVCCRFGNWGLVIKLNFCSNFEHKVWSRFWSWSSGKILKLKFGQYFAADVWLRFLLLLMLMLRNVLTQGKVKMLKLKFRQDFEAEVWSAFCCWCLSLHKKRKSFSKDVGWGKGENKGLRRTENVCCFLTRIMSTLIYNAHIHLPPSGHWLRAHLGWISLLRCVRRSLTRINGKMFPSIVARSNLFLFHVSCL